MSTTVLRPDGWVAGDPVKLLLCVHAAGGDDTDPFGTNSATARTAARAAGYTLLSVASAGYSNRDWGNPASVADYVSAYDAFDATENIVGTVLWGASMGGLAAATLAANGSIPNLLGVLLMYPVLSIADMYADNAAYRTEINAAYGVGSGGPAAAAAVSCDPYLRTTSLFAPIPWRISASSADTVVNKPHQATAFATKISGVTSVTSQATSGEHGDASNWVWSDFSGWLADRFIFPPDVSSPAAEDVTVSSANITGTVNPNALATTYRVEYGETTSYGSATAWTSAGSGSTPVSVEVPLAALSPGTAYHARIVATSAAGTTNGADVTFTTDTLPLPDVGLTLAESGIWTQSGAAITARALIGRRSTVTATAYSENGGPIWGDGEQADRFDIDGESLVGESTIVLEPLTPTTVELGVTPLDGDDTLTIRIGTPE